MRPPPAFLARYMATSELWISSCACEPCSVYRATPALNPTTSSVPLDTSGVANEAASPEVMRAASAGDCTLRRITKNSSPPKRARKLSGPIPWRISSPARTRTVSPCAWPRPSLIDLKRSRSMNTVANVSPLAFAPSMARSSASSAASRLARPVSGSCRAWNRSRFSCSSTASATATRSARSRTSSSTSSPGVPPSPQASAIQARDCSRWLTASTSTSCTPRAAKPSPTSRIGVHCPGSSA